jgi:hypothetical protein
LGTREPSCIARLAKHFYILEAHGPQGTSGTRGSAGALSSREVGSGAMGHAAMPEPSMAGW